MGNRKYSKVCMIGEQSQRLFGLNLEDLKNMCNKWNGKLLTTVEAIGLTCKNNPDNIYKVVNGNEAYDVTCKNYKDVFIGTEDGDFEINFAVFNPATPEL